MDTKGKIAVALAMVIMIVWPIVDAKLHPLPPAAPAGAPSATPATSSTSATPAVAGATTATAGANTPPTVTPPAPGAEKPAVPPADTPEETRKMETPSVDFVFTNHGGGIALAQLNQHVVDLVSNKNIVLNEYGPVPIGAVSISDQPGGSPVQDANAPYTAAVDVQGAISYQRTTERQLEITKKFTLPVAKDGVEQYLATLDLTITNRGAAPCKSDGYYVWLGSAGPIHPHDTSRYVCMDWYLNGKASEIPVSWFGASNLPIFGHPERTQYPPPDDNAIKGDIHWAGVYDQYFTTIVTPVGGGASRIWAQRVPFDMTTRQSGAEWLANNPGATASWYAIDGAIGMPGFDLAPGATVTKQFQIYIGPRQYSLLKHLDGDQVAIMRLGYSGAISRMLLKALIALQKVVGSYAVAIIVLTLGIKAALWPLQNRSTKSMKKMQALTPKMTELREKFKDDPAKLNQETIKLYKTYGVNPLAGCLPALIQLPIFVGFYSMLGTAIELRNSKFFWVHDLSQPDTVGHILGYSINVLPLCMAASSAWMMSMTPKSGDSSQQRMMMFMPLMFLFICYNYASGLALYFMVSNLFSVLQFYVTKNQTAPTLEKLAIPGKKKR